MPSAGARHTCYLSSLGRVYCRGTNMESQCDLPPAPGELTYVQVSAGEYVTAALCSDGTVAVCGGFWPSWEPMITPVTWARRLVWARLPCRYTATGMKYVSVSAGSDHVLLLRSDGGVDAMGSNDHRQCCLPQVEEGTTYTQISAGSYHSALLRSDGKAFVSGCYHEGHSYPATLPALPDGMTYTHIAAGPSYTMLLRSDLTAWIIGKHEYSVGTGGFALDVREIATRVGQIRALSCGAAHTVVMFKDGSACAFGCNKFGQCEVPTVREGDVFAEVCAGHNHTVFITEAGIAMAHGDGDKGQLEIPELSDKRDHLVVASGMTDYIVTVTLQEEPAAKVSRRNGGTQQVSGVRVACMNVAGDLVATCAAPDAKSSVRDTVLSMLPRLPCNRKLVVCLDDASLVSPDLLWTELSAHAHRE